jgi:hypothetical protein
MAVYVCGDLHGEIDIGKLSSKRFPIGKSLTKDDYLIVLGDFGLIWDTYPSNSETYFLNWLHQKPWTTLVVLGNHENYERIFSAEFPVIYKFGNTVRKVNDSVFILSRGAIYDIDDKTVFTMGGGFSIDKNRRKNRISWWEEEIPSATEFWNGLEDLKKIDFKVDYILTHTCSNIVFSKLLKTFNLSYKDGGEETLRKYLDWLELDCEFKEWHFGHFHLDYKVDDKHFCHYNGYPVELN